MAESKLKLVFEGDISPLQNSLNQIRSKLGEFSSSLGKIGTTLSTYVTAPITALGGAALGAAMKYDEAMDKIRVETGATGETLGNLEASFKKVYGSVPASMDQVSEAIATLNTRLGLTGEPLEALSTQLINLSRLTETDLNANITAATQAFNSWGVAAEDFSETLDKVFRVSQATGIGVTELLAQVTDVGPMFRSVGFSIDEATAILGLFNKAGLESTTLITGLRTAFAKFAKDGVENTREALADLFRRIKETDSATDAATIALEYFGQRAGPALVDAIRSGKLSYEDFLKTIQQSGETINGAARDTDDFAEKFTVLKNRLTLAMQSIGSVIFDTINKVMPSLENVISKFTEWFSGLSDGAKKAIVLGAGIVAAIGPAALVVSELIKAFMGLSAAFKLITAAANPVVLAIMAIALAAYEIITHWEEIKTFFINLWETIKNAARAAWETIKNAFLTAYEALKATWNAVIEFFSGLWEGVKNIFQTAWNAIAGFFQNAWNTMVNIWQGVVGWFSERWEAIKNACSSAWNTIVGFFQNAWNSVVSVWQGVVSWFSGLWSGISSSASSAWNAIVGFFQSAYNSIIGLWSQIVGWFSGLWEGIKNGAIQALNTLIGWIQSVINKIKEAIDWLKSLFSSSGTPPGGYGGIYAPYVPPSTEPPQKIWGYQQGGLITRPTLAWVGEKEPEYIFPAKKMEMLMEAILRALEKQGPLQIQQKVAVEVEPSPNSLLPLSARGVRIR